jgi:FkbM family methyltransferase
MRLGWIKLPLFLYRIRRGGHEYQMLGRPAANSGSDLFILREVLVEETYERVLDLLPPGRLRSVDVGANLGAFTVWLHRRQGIREAFCFEPNLNSYNLCRFNLSQNGCDRAQLYQQAIGGRNRETEMYTDPRRPAQSSLYRRVTSVAARAQDVEVVALNSWLDQVPGNLDLLKLDCEGAEWEILIETPEAFARFAVIVAEVHHDPFQMHQPDEFPAALDRQGFTTIHWDGHANGLYVGQRRSGGGK